MVFILGLILGSFYNVVALRGVNKESIVYPPSHCTKCHHKLNYKDLIPLLSYISLKGKCRYCGEKISIIYPFGELVTGASYLLLYVKFGYSFNLLIQIILITVLLINTLTDILIMEVKPKLIYISWVIILGLQYVKGKEFFINYMLAGLIIYGMIYCVYKLFDGKLGGGDVCVLGLIGSSIGILNTLSSLFYASIIAIIYYYLFTDRDGEKHIPFIPFIYCGVLISYFYSLYNILEGGGRLWI